MKKQFPIRLLIILLSISLLTALVGCSSHSGSEDLVMDSKPYNYLTYILDEIRKMGVFPETEEMDNSCRGQKICPMKFERNTRNKVSRPSGRLTLIIRMITYL